MLTAEELIESIYVKSIELDKPTQITDWSTWHQWMNSTHELSDHGQMSYRIISLHNQVINGGFIQYFDNRYAIFAYETLEDLQKIGAGKTYLLLLKALSIINPNDYSNGRFFDFIYFQEYEDNWESISSQFELLDTAYYDYNFEDSAEPILLLAEYFRKRNL